MTFARKSNTEIIDNLPDSVPEWKSKFFYVRLVTERDNWGVPDWWEERLPEPISAPAMELEACQRLALMYRQGTSLLPDLGASHYVGGISVFFVRSGEGVEEEAPSKKASTIDRGAALTEPNHSRTTGSAPAGPSEGISLAFKESRSVGPSGSLFLEGPPKVINLEEEGGPAPTSKGEPELPTTNGDPAPTPTFMEGPELLMCFKVLVATLEEPSSSRRDEEILRPGPFPSVWECLATTLSIVLSEARSRAKEKLEA
ncbi:hypothetical protein ACLOJK_006826 [Asimina triloba]